jgi:peptide/nickel transport system permease protein
MSVTIGTDEFRITCTSTRRFGMPFDTAVRTYDSVSCARNVERVINAARPAAGRAALITRSTLRAQLTEPYVRTAVSKGIPRRRVLVHVMRNSSVPIVTLIGFEAVTAFAGYTILVETVFSWPGLGALAAQAVGRHDLPLTEAVVFVVALIVVLSNIVIDLVYRALDPRVALTAGAAQ